MVIRRLVFIFGVSRMSERTQKDQRQQSHTTWFALALGVPLGLGALYLIQNGPWQNEVIQRYVQHLAEQVIVVLFFCCIGAFAAKMIAALRERIAQSHQLLPEWNGKPIPVNQVSQLQQTLALQGEGASRSWIGRRIANILTYVSNRGTTNGLDDQMRTLADNDAMTLDGSYALTRFLIWAMPILGFLGTVLGITEAIGGIDPEKMATDTSSITNGLTKAFDATALALSLTLVAMFFSYLVEKLEQNLLERVDVYVDAELAHRFARTTGEIGDSSALAVTAQDLIERQAALWAASLEKTEERWKQLTSPHSEEKWALAMQQALEGTLTRYSQRVVELEKKLLDRQNALLEGLARLTSVMKEGSRDHQVALARLTDAIGLSVEMMSKVQSNEGQLIRLQETLSQNLNIIASSQVFEQAVASLTGAIHLLTSRTGSTASPSPLRVMGHSKEAA